MIFDVSVVEEIIGYTFNDKTLLRQCFTHSSYRNENKSFLDNERLEFYGDAILDFVITEYLYNNDAGDEGKLTVKRSNLVSKMPLQNAILKLGLHEFLLCGNGEKKENLNEKIFSSLFEAVVAGIYIDGGINPTRKFILKNLILGENLQSNKKKAKLVKPRVEDSKSVLQEYTQKKKLGTPTYQLIEKTGPDHAPKFKVSVSLNGKVLATGEGSSKKLAEMQSASVALQKIKK